MFLSFIAVSLSIQSTNPQNDQTPSLVVDANIIDNFLNTFNASLFDYPDFLDGITNIFVLAQTNDAKVIDVLVHKIQQLNMKNKIFTLYFDSALYCFIVVVGFKRK